MRISAKAELLRSGGAGKEYTGRALTAIGNRLDDGPRGTRASEVLRPETVWQIRVQLEQLTKPGTSERLVEIWRVIVRDRDVLREAAIVWVDLIEVLVQNAERRYPAKGYGPLKKGEVQEVVLYLLKTQQFRLPDVPSYLQPVVSDVIAGITADVIVSLANANKELWIDEGGGERRSLRARLGLVIRRVGRLLAVLFRPFGWLASRIYLFFRFRAPIRPAIRSALEAVEARGKISSERGVLGDLADLKIMIGRNADAIVAIVRLVGIAVDEAEFFGDLSGPEKKEYAKDVVFAVLDELGIDTNNWITSIVIEVGLDVLIDSTVHLFDKHPHHWAQAAATTPPVPRRVAPRQVRSADTPASARYRSAATPGRKK